MTGISVAVVNRIFNKFGITFKRHEVAGFLACRGGQQIHTSTLVEACQKVLEQWFVVKEVDSNSQTENQDKKPLKYVPGDEA